MKRSRLNRSTPEQIREWRRTSKPLSRGNSRLKRTPLSPVGRRRAKLREEQFGEQAEACRESPCCVCGAPPPSDPHHVVPRSRGGTDADTVPLCRPCHRKGHTVGWSRFEKTHGVDLASIAERLSE